MLDVETIRDEFPILDRQLGGKPIVFADNAATTLKPRCVIEAVHYYYSHVCANVHRGVNALSEEADELYESARRDIAQLIHARPDEIVFVRNATEAINLAAHLVNLSNDSEVICSLGDHHSNLLPWSTTARARFVTPDQNGSVTAASFVDAITPRTKLIALGHVSNITGMITPVGEIIREARKRGILTLIDASQSVAHIPIDVRDLGCDFLAFSGHKMLGPSGIGVLYGRKELLEAGSPMLYGGGMVAEVSHKHLKLAPSPHKFEAGTPNIEGAIGMGSAAGFLTSIGGENIYEHSRQLTEALIAELQTVKRLQAFPGDVSAERIPVVSFTVESIPADNIAAILSTRYSIMIRSGAHCAEPLVRHFGERSLARISLHLYNTLEEIAYIGDSLRKLCSMFR